MAFALQELHIIFYMVNSFENGQPTYDKLKDRLGPEATASLMSFLSHTLVAEPSSGSSGRPASLSDEDKEVFRELFRKLQDEIMFSNNKLQTELTIKLNSNFQELQKSTKDTNKVLTDIYDRLNNMETNIYHLQEEALCIRKKQSGMFVWLFLFCILTIAGTYAAIKFLKI